MIKRLLAVCRKEFIEIYRDPRSLIMVLLLPIMLLILYSYSLDFDIKAVKTAVYDPDRSTYSRELIAKFKNSDFVIHYIDNYNDVEKMLNNRKARLALCFPSDFSKKLLKGESAPLQAILDGSDANSATIIIQYVTQIAQQMSVDIAISYMQARGINMEGKFPPIKAEPRSWYNPELKSINFLVPGLIAIVMMMVGTISTSLSIVGERERGTFEKLIVTPVRPYELALGKIIPYILLTFIDIVLCLLVGVIWFKVPFKGSVSLLMSLSVIFLFSALGLGLLVSAVVNTQRLAMLLSATVSLLPSFLLSGFAFSIDDMPRFLQIVSYFVPAKYF
ncbi:ABC transporter permease, partial [Candidatus Poribacteria bacterium]|nr:ABC transporter permease [Candidatus Poribacteria bacterium]